MFTTFERGRAELVGNTNLEVLKTGRTLGFNRLCALQREHGMELHRLQPRSGVAESHKDV